MLHLFRGNIFSDSGRPKHGHFTQFWPKIQVRFFWVFPNEFFVCKCVLWLCQSVFGSTLVKQNCSLGPFWGILYVTFVSRQHFQWFTAHKTWLFRTILTKIQVRFLWVFPNEFFVCKCVLWLCQSVFGRNLVKQNCSLGPFGGILYVSFVSRQHFQWFTAPKTWSFRTILTKNTSAFFMGIS